MNLTQSLMVLVPTGLMYLYLVFAMRSNGRVNHAHNALVGLLVVPMLIFALPFLLLSVGVDLMRKRNWGGAAGVFVGLLLVAAYGALVFHLRDQPPPSADDLPVEAPLVR